MTATVDTPQPAAPLQQVTVPAIGDFSDIPIIEVHVAEGDTVAENDPLVTLESDKATMDVPATVAGTVQRLHVKLGDRVNVGSLLLSLLPTTSGSPSTGDTAAQAGDVDQQEPAPKRSPMPPPRLPPPLLKRRGRRGMPLRRPPLPQPKGTLP